MSTPLIGVLGGMGPLATVDLLHKIVEETPASRDQDHVPVVAWNVPQIPDRQQALAGTGESPLPTLLHAIRQLNRLSVSHIVVPCNTAHHWFEALTEASDAPLLHIADVTLHALTQADEAKASPRKIGLIATHGTLTAGWYQQRFATQLGAETVVPNEQEMTALFVPGCYAVKTWRITARWTVAGSVSGKAGGAGSRTSGAGLHGSFSGTGGGVVTLARHQYRSDTRAGAGLRSYLATEMKAAHCWTAFWQITGSHTLQRTPSQRHRMCSRRSGPAE